MWGNIQVWLAGIMLEIPGQCRCKNWNNCTVQQRKTLRNERFDIMIFYSSQKKMKQMSRKYASFFLWNLVGLPRFMTTCRVRYLGDFSNTEAETTWETSKKQRLKTILMALKPLGVPIFVQVSLFSGGVLFRIFCSGVFPVWFLTGSFSPVSFVSVFSGRFFPVHFFRFMFQIFSGFFFSGYFCRCYSFQIHILYSFRFFQVSFSSDVFQVSLFSGVIFHGCFSGYIFCMIVFARFDFFQVAWKTSNFMLRFHVVFLSFLLPSSRNEAAACASFADLDGDGNLEALTGCNCLFLVFGG